jgi:hypothetical protein
VTFDNEKCEVIYNEDVILRGFKDPSTDLWTLPIKTSKMWADNTVLTIDQCEPRTGTKGDEVHPGVDIATFSHSIRTRGNGVKFAHQSLCNPKISTLLKAVRRGFLRGCPNMTEKLILKLGWEFRFGIPFPGTTGIRNSASEFGVPELSGGKANRKT